MAYPRKIATCCYCGTRAALVLKGKIRHELACSNCGAPLHDLKMLPADRTGERELVTARKPKNAPTPKKTSVKKPNRGRKRKRKSFVFFKELAEEAFDFIEDIFD